MYVFVKIGCFLQAIGARGIIPEQCREMVKEYVPQLIKLVQALPPDQASLPFLQTLHLLF
jgi:hypothetical protein